MKERLRVVGGNGGEPRGGGVLPGEGYGGVRSHIRPLESITRGRENLRR